MFSLAVVCSFIFLLTIEDVSTHVGRNFESKPSVKWDESGTKYLLNIYNTLNEKGDDSLRPKRSTTEELSSEEQKVINESDSIMVFNGLGIEDNPARIGFNVSDSVATGSNISDVQLKVFQNGKKSRTNVTGSYIVTAYQRVTDKSGEEISTCSSKIKTSDGFTGWLSFNLTSCLSNRTTINAMQSIFLSVHPEDKPDETINAKNFGLVISNAIQIKRPFLAVFSKSDSQLKIKSVQINSSVLENKNSTFCRRRSFYVNYTEIGWDSFIIAPLGHESYLCVGDCPSTTALTSSTFDMSNHAKIQALVHEIHPENIPKPCCVPTNYNPVTVLYITTDDNVVLKHIEDMVVKKCGCR